MELHHKATALITVFGAIATIALVCWVLSDSEVDSDSVLSAMHESEQGRIVDAPGSSGSREDVLLPKISSNRDSAEETDVLSKGAQNVKPLGDKPSMHGDDYPQASASPINRFATHTVVVPDPGDPERFELRTESQELGVLAPTEVGATKLVGLTIPVLAECRYVGHRVTVLSRSPPSSPDRKSDGITGYDDVLERDQKRIVKVSLRVSARRIDDPGSSIKVRLTVESRCARSLQMQDGY